MSPFPVPPQSRNTPGVLPPALQAPSWNRPRASQMSSPNDASSAASAAGAAAASATADRGQPRRAPLMPTDEQGNEEMAPQIVRDRARFLKVPITLPSHLRVEETPGDRWLAAVRIFAADDGREVTDFYDVQSQPSRALHKASNNDTSDDEAYAAAYVPGQVWLHKRPDGSLATVLHIKVIQKMDRTNFGSIVTIRVNYLRVPSVGVDSTNRINALTVGSKVAPAGGVKAKAKRGRGGGGVGGAAAMRGDGGGAADDGPDGAAWEVDAAEMEAVPPGRRGGRGGGGGAASGRKRGGGAAAAAAAADSSSTAADDLSSDDGGGGGREYDGLDGDGGEGAAAGQKRKRPAGRGSVLPPPATPGAASSSATRGGRGRGRGRGRGAARGRGGAQPRRNPDDDSRLAIMMAAATAAGAEDIIATTPTSDAEGAGGHGFLGGAAAIGALAGASIVPGIPLSGVIAAAIIGTQTGPSSHSAHDDGGDAEDRPRLGLTENLLTAGSLPRVDPRGGGKMGMPTRGGVRVLSAAAGEVSLPSPVAEPADASAALMFLSSQLTTEPPRIPGGGGSGTGDSGGNSGGIATSSSLSLVDPMGLVGTAGGGGRGAPTAARVAAAVPPPSMLLNHHAGGKGTAAHSFSALAGYGARGRGVGIGGAIGGSARSSGATNNRQDLLEQGRLAAGGLSPSAQYIRAHSSTPVVVSALPPRPHTSLMPAEGSDAASNLLHAVGRGGGPGRGQLHGGSSFIGDGAHGMGGVSSGDSMSFLTSSNSPSGSSENVVYNSASGSVFNSSSLSFAHAASSTTTSSTNTSSSSSGGSSSSSGHSNTSTTSGNSLFVAVSSGAAPAIFGGAAAASAAVNPLANRQQLLLQSSSAPPAFLPKLLPGEEGASGAFSGMLQPQHAPLDPSFSVVSGEQQRGMIMTSSASPLPLPAYHHETKAGVPFRAPSSGSASATAAAAAAGGGGAVSAAAVPGPFSSMTTSALLGGLAGTSAAIQRGGSVGGFGSIPHHHGEGHTLHRHNNQVLVFSSSHGAGAGAGGGGAEHNLNSPGGDFSQSSLSMPQQQHIGGEEGGEGGNRLSSAGASLDL